MAVLAGFDTALSEEMVRTHAQNGSTPLPGKSRAGVSAAHKEKAMVSS